MTKTNILQKLSDVGIELSDFSADDFNCLVKNFIENHKFEGDELAQLKKTFENGFDTVTKEEKKKIKDKIEALKKRLDSI